MSDNPTTRTPLWMTLLCILSVLPAFQLPALLTRSDGHNTAMLWIYPFYLILACWAAWRSWAQRPLMSWILLAVALLSDIAIWYV